MIKRRPYIGITDFTDPRQVSSMLEVFKNHVSPTSERILHVGVMMSHKTLNDKETRFAKVFPRKEDIASIFWSEEVFNCLHFADYEHSENVEEDLIRALVYSGERVNAIQLDMVWPDPTSIINTLDASPKQDIEVILQIGKNSMEILHNDPKKIVEKLKTYEGTVDRVLLDRSMGRGLGMDAEGLIPLASTIKKELPYIDLVAAGGLGPKSIALVRPLFEKFPEISIDAQGKLRPSGYILDPIDWSMAETYLIKALELFNNN